MERIALLTTKQAEAKGAVMVMYGVICELRKAIRSLGGVTALDRSRCRDLIRHRKANLAYSRLWTGR